MTLVRTQKFTSKFSSLNKQVRVQDIIQAANRLWPQYKIVLWP